MISNQLSKFCDASYMLTGLPLFILMFPLERSVENATSQLFLSEKAVIPSSNE